MFHMGLGASPLLSFLFKVTSQCPCFFGQAILTWWLSALCLGPLWATGGPGACPQLRLHQMGFKAELTQSLTSLVWAPLLPLLTLSLSSNPVPSLDGINMGHLYRPSLSSRWFLKETKPKTDLFVFMKPCHCWTSSEADAETGFGEHYLS